MQGVDEEAVGEDSAPRAEQGGGADAVGIAAEDRISERCGEREDQERRERQQPGDALLCEHPHIRAVGRDRGDLLELTRAGAETA